MPKLFFDVNDPMHSFTHSFIHSTGSEADTGETEISWGTWEQELWQGGGEREAHSCGTRSDFERGASGKEGGRGCPGSSPGTAFRGRFPGLRQQPSPAHLLCVNVRAESGLEHSLGLRRQSRLAISLINRIRTHK